MKDRIAALIRLARSANLPTLAYLGVGAIGVLLLLQGLRLPWFPLPGHPPADKLEPTSPLFVGIETHGTRLWKMALALMLAACAVATWKLPARRRSTACLGLSAIAAILLFYPCSLLYLAPAEATRANWLQIQHRNLTWLGGDVFGSSETKGKDRKFNVSIVDIPRQVGAVKIPKSVPYLLDVGRLSEASEWLGYSDAFCYFVGRGWLAAVAGTVLLLASVVRAGESLDHRLVRVALKGFGVTASVLGLLALSPVVLTGYAVGRAHEAMQAGDYGDSKRWLERAGHIMPVIRENSFYLIQIGLSDVKTGADTLLADQFRGVRLEEGGFHAQAEVVFSEVLDRSPPNSAIQRESLRGLLRAAIRCLNSGQTDHGITLLQWVLRVDPVNLKANHCLQLAYLRTHRLAELEETFTAMRQIYGFIGTMTKVPVLAACQENEVLARFLDGNLDDALAVKMKKP